MDQAPEKQVGRRVGMALARVGALAFSIGAVGFLMFRAGLGCSGTTEATRDTGSPQLAVTGESGSSEANGSDGAPTSATATTTASVKPRFAGGSKAWSDPELVELVTGSSANKSAAPPAQAPEKGKGGKPAPPPPEFFPPTKSAPLKLPAQKGSP